MFRGAVLEGVNECEAGNSPPEIGGVDATSRRSHEASFAGADGVVRHGTPSNNEPIPKYFGNPDHPVCAAAVASHLFIDGAATPPISKGEWRAQITKYARSQTASTVAPV
jgi:hypothetical protein